MIDRKEIEDYVLALSPLPTGMKPFGRLQKSVHAVLFDVYGTLFISGSGDIGTMRRQTQGQKIERLVRKYRLARPPEELTEAFFEQIEAVHREKSKKGIEAPEVEIDRVWMAVLGIDDRSLARRFAVEYELIVNPVYPMPGAEKTLSGLHKKGVFMGIVSNAQFFTPWLFSWFFGNPPEGLGFDPELQIYSYRFGVAKPSTALFIAAARRLQHLGVSPDQALVVGNDMRNDVAAAQRAGFQTALFAGDARSLRLREDDPDCRDTKPDLVVTELVQLLDHV
ncbi:MAG: HAD family hydrolase [Desulfobacterales bacterium]|nr:HAD family hydrolase [Desulfobacterales bacterium]